MPVIPEEHRLVKLREMGLSDAVIRLSAGELVHEMFEFRCKTPFYVYHGANLPEGPVFCPLWDCGDRVTGVWEPDGRPEYIQFSIEATGSYWAVAKTEQGLLAALFSTLYEDEDQLDLDGFREPARSIGFRYLDEVVSSYEQSVHLDHSEHEAFLRRLIAHIDQLEEGRSLSPES